MPRKDDEQSIGAREAVPIVDFNLRNKPRVLMNAFQDLWRENPASVYSIDSGGSLMWSDWNFQTGLFLALEHLRKLEEIPDAAIFGKDGRLRKDAKKSEVKELFGSDGILKGKKVLVFGGPEAEVFQAMGADAVGFDPAFLKARPANWQARQHAVEIEMLTDIALNEPNGFADLTYSSRLFDSGSGLASIRTERDAFTRNLSVILNLTRVGGLSIHDGNGVAITLYPKLSRHILGPIKKSYTDVATELIRDVKIGDTPVRVVEIAPRAFEDRVGDSGTTYVLQRK